MSGHVTTQHVLNCIRWCHTWTSATPVAIKHKLHQHHPHRSYIIATSYVASAKTWAMSIVLKYIIYTRHKLSAIRITSAQLLALLNWYLNMRHILQWCHVSYVASMLNHLNNLLFVPHDQEIFKLYRQPELTHTFTPSFPLPSNFGIPSHNILLCISPNMDKIESLTYITNYFVCTIYSIPSTNIATVCSDCILGIMVFGGILPNNITQKPASHFL